MCGLEAPCCEKAVGGAIMTASKMHMARDKTSKTSNKPDTLRVTRACWARWPPRHRTGRLSAQTSCFRGVCVAGWRQFSRRTAEPLSTPQLCQRENQGGNQASFGYCSELRRCAVACSGRGARTAKKKPSLCGSGRKPEPGTAARDWWFRPPAAHLRRPGCGAPALGRTPGPAPRRVYFKSTHSCRRFVI